MDHSDVQVRTDRRRWYIAWRSKIQADLARSQWLPPQRSGNCAANISFEASLQRIASGRQTTLSQDPKTSTPEK